MNDQTPFKWRALAAEFLMNMSQLDANKNAISAAGGLEVLVQQLNTSAVSWSPEIALPAAGAVYRLINSHQQRQQIASALGLIPATIKLLQNDSMDVPAAAVAILLAMSKNNDLLSSIQAEVQAQEAVTLLARLLSSSDTTVQCNVAGTLMLLASNEASIREATAAAAGVINPLVRMLASSNTDVQLAAVGALESLVVESLWNQAAIAAVPGAVEQLRMLSTSTVGPIAEKAVVVQHMLEAGLVTGLNEQKLKQEHS